MLLALFSEFISVLLSTDTPGLISYIARFESVITNESLPLVINAYISSLSFISSFGTYPIGILIGIVTP
nr:MAG TPA: hypothetical protein [Caudoviricetes sp.]